MQGYKVLEPIKHNGIDYIPGMSIPLDESNGLNTDRLIASGVLGKVGNITSAQAEAFNEAVQEAESNERQIPDLQGLNVVNAKELIDGIRDSKVLRFMELQEKEGRNRVSVLSAI